MPSELIVFPSQRIHDVYWESAGTILPPRQATTLPRLIRQMLKEARPQLSPLSYPARLLLLQNLVEAYSAKEPSHFFSRIAATAGFLRHLSDFLSECKKALLSPQIFHRLAREGQLPQEERRRLQALADLFAAYQEALAAHQPPLADQDDMERHLAERLEAGERFLCLEGYDTLYVSHLTHLTPLRFRLLRALSGSMAARGASVGLSIIFDPEKPEGVFRFAAYTLTPIEKLGEELAAVNPPDFLSLHAVARPAPLAYLLEHLSRRYPYVRDPEDPPPPEGAERCVKLIRARGKYEEVEEVARRVRNLLEEGAPPHTIAVICRDLAPYGEIVEEVFTRYRLPFSFRRGFPCLASPLVRAILSVYDYLANPSDHLLAKVLLSVYFGYACGEAAQAARLLLPKLGAHPDFHDNPLLAVSRLTERAKRRLEEPTLHPQEKEMDAKLLQALALAEQTLSPFLQDIAPLQRAHSLSEHLLALQQLLARRRVRERLAFAHPRLLARDQRALALFFQTLDSLAAAARQVGFDPPQRPAQLLRLLREALSNAMVPTHTLLEGVQVLKVDDALGLTYDTVFVVGLTSHLFPRRAYEQPLLSEQLKEGVNRLLAPRRAFMPLPARYLEEAYLFFLAVLAARERLILCWHEQDESERPVVPSPYLQTVAEILQLPLSEVAQEKATSPGSFTSVPELPYCFNYLELLGRMALDLQAHERPKELQAKALEKAIQNHPRLATSYHFWRLRAQVEKEREEFFRQGEAPTKASGRLVCEKAKEWIRHRHLAPFLSPTRLESFGFCPYQFFAQHVLRIEEEEEPSEELTPLDEGSLYHQILERFLQQKKEKGEPVWREEDQELLDRVMEETARTFAKLHLSPLSAWLFKAKVESIRRHLATFFRYSLPEELKTARVWGSEVSFGYEGALPAVSLALDEELDPIAFRGRIDALFKAGNQLAVVDFKTTADLGGKRYKLLLHSQTGDIPDMIGKVGWQLPVYALAVQAGLDAHKLPITACLLALKAKPPKSKKSKSAKSNQAWLSLEWDEATRELFAQNASQTIARLRDGSFPVAPLEEEVSCPYCPFRSLCRFEPAEELEEEG